MAPREKRGRVEEAGRFVNKKREFAQRPSDQPALSAALINADCSNERCERLLFVVNNHDGRRAVERWRRKMSVPARLCAAPSVKYRLPAIRWVIHDRALFLEYGQWERLTHQLVAVLRPVRSRQFIEPFEVHCDVPLSKWRAHCLG